MVVGTMTSDRVLTLIALIWFALALLYLAAAGVIPAGAAVLQDGDDSAMTCGTWTYYAPGVMDTARRNHGLSVCEDCAGMAATVDQRLLGGRIEVWYAGEWRGVFQVADVGQPGRNRAGLVGEVEAETAWAWGRTAPWWGCYREMQETPR